MKWLLLILGAVLMVLVLVLGGGVAWIMNLKTDVKDPAFAAKFQKSMTDVCLSRAKSEIRGAGETLDYQQEELVRLVCECDVKEMMKIVAKKGAKTPVEMQKAAMDSEQEMNAAFQSCAAAHGLQ